MPITEEQLSARLPAPATSTRLSPPLPSKRQRYVYLDVMRAVAVLLVLGAHYPLRIPEETYGYHLFMMWRRFGWIGVDLFFVLSGFLVGGLLFAEQARHGKIKYGRFLIRRSFKIWPCYLALLAFACAWDVVRGSGAWLHRLGDTASRAWPYLLQIQNYNGPLVDRIGHTWSLAVEEHFYLLLPLLLAVLTWFAARSSTKLDGAQRKPFAALPWVFAVIFALSPILRFVQWRVHPHFDEFVHHWPTHLRIDSLMAGVMLAWLVHFHREKIESLREWRSVIVLASITCFVPFGFRFADLFMPFAFTIGYTILAIGASGFVLVAWMASTSDEPSWVARNFAKIGVFSYSIYLWHMPLSNPVTRAMRNHLGDSLHLWGSGAFYTLMIAIYVGLAVLWGTISYLVIEKPALAVRDRMFPSRTASSVPATPIQPIPGRPADLVQPSRMPEAFPAAA